MSFRLAILLAGAALAIASVSAQALNPQPLPPSNARMRPIAPYLAGPQPDPPIIAAKRRSARLALRFLVVR